MHKIHQERKMKDLHKSNEFVAGVKTARWKSAVLGNQTRPSTYYYKQLISREEKKIDKVVEPKININSDQMFLKPKSKSGFENDVM